MTTSTNVERQRTTALIACPMHGQIKLSSEGYRTRDGHLIEWCARLLVDRGEVAVLSRPEPLLLEGRNRRRLRGPVVANTRPVESRSWRVPDPRDVRRWWVASLPDYRAEVLAAATTTPAMVWNPMVFVSRIEQELCRPERRVLVDLLDDWSLHYAFESVRDEVVTAYRRAFARADVVTANSEGTLDLAHRFGRTDVLLVPNGCDPHKFSPLSRASGKTTVGYTGKIGKRVDLELVEWAAHELPGVTFVFAGPVLDREYGTRLRRLENVDVLGDVRYDELPGLLSTFDIGWVPHRVGAMEVGGDVIKTYEYRAAGLPVLTTPIIGAGARDLEEVAVRRGADHVAWLRERVLDGPRVARVAQEIPGDLTWQVKADQLLQRLLGELPDGR